MESLSRYRGYIALTLLYASLLGGYILYDRKPQPEPIEIIEPTVVETPTPTPAPIQVHVVGAVRRPGVYTLPPESRLFQAVAAAGGMTEDADQERINLAERIYDGQQVYVPRRGTPIPPSPTPMTAASNSRGGQQPAGITQKININTATAAELETLPGIGPVYAERIIAYRQEHGPFKDPAEIKKVKGIGQARYEQLKALITVN